MRYWLRFGYTAKDKDYQHENMEYVKEKILQTEPEYIMYIILQFYYIRRC